VAGHQYSRAGGTYAPLNPRMALQSGDVVQTATVLRSIFFSRRNARDRAPCSEHDARAGKAVNAHTNAKSSFEIQLDFAKGNCWASPRRCPRLAIGGQGFQRDRPLLRRSISDHARGYLVLIDGRARFPPTTPVGDPVAHSLKAPPAVYFSPVRVFGRRHGNLEREVIQHTAHETAGVWKPEAPYGNSSMVISL